MKKKPGSNDIFITVITVMIAIFIVIMTIFFNKYQDAQEDKNKYQRLVEIYKKADNNDGATKKRYVEKLNKAEDELKKVKKETNYKNYNEKTDKERRKEDEETKDRIYEASKDEDLVLVRNEIEASDKVDKPEILISEDGVGTITVPEQEGYENQTVGTILVSILASPYLIDSTPSSDDILTSTNAIDSSFPSEGNILQESITGQVTNTMPPTSSIVSPTNNNTGITTPETSEPVTPVTPVTPPNVTDPGITEPTPTLPPVDNSGGSGVIIPAEPGTDIDEGYNPNPPPPGYTDEDGGKGSGGGGEIIPPDTDNPSEGNDGSETPEPEPEQPPVVEEPDNPEEGTDTEPGEDTEKPKDNDEEQEENTTTPPEEDTEKPEEPDTSTDEGNMEEEPDEEVQDPADTEKEQPEEEPDDNVTSDKDKTTEE